MDGEYNNSNRGTHDKASSSHEFVSLHHLPSAQYSQGYFVLFSVDNRSGRPVPVRHVPEYNSQALRAIARWGWNHILEFYLCINLLTCFIWVYHVYERHVYRVQ